MEGRHQPDGTSPFYLSGHHLEALRFQRFLCPKLGLYMRERKSLTGVAAGNVCFSQLLLSCRLLLQIFRETEWMLKLGRCLICQHNNGNNRGCGALGIIWE